MSHVEITTFFLVGMPRLEYAHIWISIPVCSMYLVAILGNCTILFIIKTEPSLHEPMYYFLSMLALSDMGLSFSSLPTMLRIFLFKASEISANACFAQEFFIHGFTALESSVLLIMSFDRFLAIHNPLRYSSILKTVRVAQIGVDVMKLACSDNRIDVIYGFLGALCLMVDFMLIAVSYILILKTVLGKNASQKEQLKALNTCVSHICAVTIFYLPIINLAIVHRFARHVSPLFNVLMANVLLLVPPLMNPIVYCVKTRQIRDVMKLACSDNRVNVVYGLFAALSTILDLLFITFSYIMILKTVLGIATPKEQLKALNTCISHICAVLIFYVPMLSAAMLHHFARGVSPMIHILMADVFLLVPPLMNPIVYCVKTHQIQEKIMGKLCPKRS
ncbi:Olfactory receptor 51A4 [Camelus dromedarius]|uniref:Olfactory receptor 51A4 n=1 Tax=Camelus dromedarius TaxID=9838 RepID=A0A5N4DM32_CAMDR|nr:Olfactory receptor 51A4 [Camelus dromedarius]